MKGLKIMNENVMRKLIFREIKDDIVNVAIMLGLILLTMGGIVFIGFVGSMVFIKFGVVGIIVFFSVIFLLAICRCIFVKAKSLYNSKRIECEKLYEQAKVDIMIYAHNFCKYDKDSLIEIANYSGNEIYKQLVSNGIDELEPELLELKNGNIPEKYKKILDK